MRQEWPQASPSTRTPARGVDRIVAAGAWVILTVFVTLLVLNVAGALEDEAIHVALVEGVEAQYAGMAEENARLHEEIERLLEPGLRALALESCEPTSPDPGFPGWVDPLQQHGRGVEYLLNQTMSEATCTGIH